MLVSVLHGDSWYPGHITAWRTVDDTWTGYARFTVAVGALYWHWKPAEQMRPRERITQ